MRDPTAEGSRPSLKKGPNRTRVPALLARFPRPGRRYADYPVFPQDPTGYEELADDLRLWEGEFLERFREFDLRAVRTQNAFWGQNVILILGGALATTFGAVQAALGGGSAWIGVVQSVLAGLLAGTAVLVRGRRAQQGYMSSRLKAERLKSEFFLFLAKVGPYAHPTTRVRMLRQRFDEIENAEGAS